MSWVLFTSVYFFCRCADMPVYFLDMFPWMLFILGSFLDITVYCWEKSDCMLFILECYR